MPCKLSVNVNAVAYLRNRRSVGWPDVAQLARLALAAGADGITVHPRPDERHIRGSDVPALGDVVHNFPGAEFNIEGFPDDRLFQLCRQVLPQQVTLVPDKPEQGTSDHGWDFSSAGANLAEAIGTFKGLGCRVSLFIEPDPAAPALAKAAGADRVEIYTGPYGGAATNGDVRRQFERVVATGRAAAKLGLGLNAGHDLTRANLPPLVAALPNLAEVSIGHALFADAWEFGLAETVRLYKAALALTVASR